MQKNVGGTDRTLRLVVGTLLLAVAAATYTQRLSLALSVVLTVALVGAVAVSGFYLVTGARPNWSLASAPRMSLVSRRFVHRTDDFHPPDRD
ncbi:MULTISPECIES: DUF2892 domain-containing protein [unclassified Haladaptatus]|uniref:YgaP family membrane protein n=1 Tax=unclassified Haladaptatus TaxID=2622732 RepID=UPI0023E7BEE7|nr:MULTISPECIES: DUF2892 domain-containing protein [unclassified Haladaptatus]